MHIFPSLFGPHSHFSPSVDHSDWVKVTVNNDTSPIGRWVCFYLPRLWAGPRPALRSWLCNTNSDGGNATWTSKITCKGAGSFCLAVMIWLPSHFGRPWVWDGEPGHPSRGELSFLVSLPGVRRGRRGLGLHRLAPPPTRHNSWPLWTPRGMSGTYSSHACNPDSQNVSEMNDCGFWPRGFRVVAPQEVTGTIFTLLWLKFIFPCPLPRQNVCSETVSLFCDAGVLICLHVIVKRSSFSLLSTVCLIFIPSAHLSVLLLFAVYARSLIQTFDVFRPCVNIQVAAWNFMIKVLANSLSLWYENFSEFIGVEWLYCRLCLRLIFLSNDRFSAVWLYRCSRFLHRHTPSSNWNYPAFLFLPGEELKMKSIFNIHVFDPNWFWTALSACRPFVFPWL